MKYILFHNYKAILFSDDISHRDMAEVLFRNHNIKKTVLSAGFCSLKDGKVECYGESVSLGIKSLPGDSDILGVYLQKRGQDVPK